jgi:predicted nucleic acid-binding protein
MLLDSNIIIYAFDPAFQNVTNFLRGRSFSASVVTQIEVMGFWRLSDEEYQRFEAFFASLRIIEVSADIVRQAILLRRRRSMSLADAIIAATALVHGLPVITHNAEDFNGIHGLQVIDPVVAS